MSTHGVCNLQGHNTPLSFAWCSSSPHQSAFASDSRPPLYFTQLLDFLTSPHLQIIVISPVLEADLTRFVLMQYKLYLLLYTNPHLHYHLLRTLLMPPSFSHFSTVPASIFCQPSLAFLTLAFHHSFLPTIPLVLFSISRPDHLLQPHLLLLFSPVHLVRGEVSGSFLEAQRA